MSSWFSDKFQERVNKFVREAPNQVPDAFRSFSQSSQSRSADELASELEKQARRVSDPQAAIELLSKWVERSDSGYGSFSLSGGADGEDAKTAGRNAAFESLSFYEALLRSRALEALVEACGRAAPLRAELQRANGSDSAVPLSQALRLAADRLLLPGALALWPNLLEVIIAAAADDGDSRSKGSSERVVKGRLSAQPRCLPWAKRALSVLKRRWQNEMLPAFVKRLDRELTTLACKRAPAEGDAASADLLRQQAAGKRLSKTGIRAALAKEKVVRCTADAEKLRTRTELLCDLCERLQADERSCTSCAPEAEKLLQDADDMLSALDTGVKDCTTEQEKLQVALTEASVGLDEQIKEKAGMLDSFTDKRSALQEQKNNLLRRLEEVNMQLVQIDQATGALDKEAQDLRDKLKDTKNWYQEKIAGSFCQQKRLADEKLRAVACKACAHSALDVVINEEKRRSADLAAQQRRRRAELRRTCAAYLHQERLRLNAVVDCLEAKRAQKSTASTSSSESSPVASSLASAPGATAEERFVHKAATAAKELWKGAQAVMTRVSPLLKAGDVADAATEAAAAAAAATEEGDRIGEDSEAPVDAQAFFARTASLGRCCVDCCLPDADWASVSFGTYLCVDCAGRHRGLGVHLSFVRSITMDNWSPEQLRRMQLGGTKRFQEFLATYPRLRDPPQSSAALNIRYNSRAASHYRRLLDIRCEGGDAASLQPPPPEEGHLPAGDSSSSAGISQSGDGHASAATGHEETEEMPMGTLEEELAALESLFRRQQQNLTEGSSSPTGESLTEVSSSPIGETREQASCAALATACEDVPSDAVEKGTAADLAPPLGVANDVAAVDGSSSEAADGDTAPRTVEPPQPTAVDPCPPLADIAPSEGSAAALMALAGAASQPEGSEQVPSSAALDALGG